MTPKFKYTEDDLIKELKRVSDLLGRAPTFAEMKDLGRIRPETYHARFGGWGNARLLLGYRPLCLVSDDELIAELKRVAELLGYPPTHAEMKRLSKISPKTYHGHFGSWQDAKRYVGWVAPWEQFNPETISASDGAWLSGMIDGEGCFRITRHKLQPVFLLSLRDDDTFSIDEIARILYLSPNCIRYDERACDRKRGCKQARPALRIQVSAIPILAHHLNATLRRFPLRTRKKYQFVIFDNYIDFRWRHGENGRHNFDQETKNLFHRFAAAIAELKQYHSDPHAICAKHGLADLNDQLETYGTKDYEECHRKYLDKIVPMKCKELLTEKPLTLTT